MAKAGTPRKRTADYDAPPLGALVGTFNNPGVRYFVRKINEDGSVDVTETPACPLPHWSLWENKTFTREEWATLMDRWVLVWIGREVVGPTRVAVPFKEVTNEEFIGLIKDMAVIHFGPAPELTFGQADK